MDTEEDEDETTYGGKDQPDDEEEETEEDTQPQLNDPSMEPISEEERNYPNPDDFPDSNNN